MKVPVEMEPNDNGSTLELRALSKRFGSVVAVDNVDLTVRPGELITLLGPSGSGKSTILGLIAGFQVPTAGHIYLRGRDISALTPAERNVGVVFQHYALFPHMTVGDNVEYGLKMRGVDKHRRRKRVGEMLSLVKLAGLEERLPRQLSGGQQQRVALARALAFEPSILLMDEPLGALDREIRSEMEGEVRRIHRELGTTILYVTHDKEEALALSDRIGVMRLGRIVALDVPSRLYERPTSAFVAAFFCGSNLIPVRVIERLVAGGTRVEYRGTRFVVAGGGEVCEAEVCLLAVPPEKLRLTERGDCIHLPVRVRDVVYLGGVTQIRGVSEGGERIVARIPSEDASGVKADNHIGMYVRSVDAALVPREEMAS